MNPPAAAKLQQTLPTGSKVFMWMFERQLLQGLLLRPNQFNSTFHRQAGHQNRIACQTPYFESRLPVTLKMMIRLTSRYPDALPVRVDERNNADRAFGRRRRSFR